MEVNRIVSSALVIANGQPIAAKLTCMIEEFLVGHGLLPRSVVVEHTPLPKLEGRVSLCP